MTTAAKSARGDYLEDGVTLLFPARFRYLAPSDLLVERILVSRVKSTLVLGVDYTATAGASDDGGTVTLIASVAGAKLRIRRVTARRQGTDYQTNDTFPAESHEAALDRAMLIDQEQDVRIDDTEARAILAPEGSSGGVLPLDRAGKFFAFDAQKRPVAASGTGNDAALRYDIAQTTGAALIGTGVGGSVQDNIELLRDNIRYSLEPGDTYGTPTLNQARVQAKIEALYALGGGTLIVNEPLLEIDRPFIMRPYVNFKTKPGLRVVIVNTLAPYAFRQSAIIAPGNFHPIATTQMWADPNSKPLNAVGPGDPFATLAVAGDTAGFVVGDMVVFFSTSAYVSSGNNIAEYMPIRKITRIVGSVLYVDRPFGNGIAAGAVYNLRTGTILGQPTVAGGVGEPLYVYHDAEVSGFEVSTIGYWIADSATYNVNFRDIWIQKARALWYGNTYQFTVYNNVSGNFGLTAGELSLNSEGTIVENFTAAYSPELGLVPSVCVSQQENAYKITYRNGLIDVTGFTASQNVVSVINAQLTSVTNVQLRHGGAAFTGVAISVGDPIPGAGRMVTTDTKIDVKWSGPCARYVILQGAPTTGTVIDGTYSGTPTTNEAFRFNGTAAKNTIARTAEFRSGRGVFVAGTSGQEVVGCYIAGGMAALAGTDYSTLAANHVRDVRTANSVARRGGNGVIAQTFVATATDDDVLAGAIGTATLQRQDVIAYSAVIDCSAGVAGTKTVNVKIVNTTDGVTYTPISYQIPAGVTGTYEFDGVINVTTAALLVPIAKVQAASAAARDAVTVSKTKITNDLSAKALTIKITAIKGSAGDTATIGSAQIALNNPVQI